MNWNLELPGCELLCALLASQSGLEKKKISFDQRF